MPCAGPDHSCNSLISIRSPLGEVRLGDPNSARPGPRPIRLVIRAYSAIREAFAHRRQRQALAKLDGRLLDDSGLSHAEAEHEIRKPFWK